MSSLKRGFLSAINPCHSELVSESHVLFRHSGLDPESQSNDGLELTPHPNPLPQGARERVAFTLAEVLITLGIIGIVAAMTLPTLIQKQQKKITETRLKQSFSVLQQAIVRAEVDYGEITGWKLDGVTSGSVFRKYFKPYMKIIKQGTVSSADVDFFELSGAPEVALLIVKPTASFYVLADGTYLLVTDRTISGNMDIVVDINGFTKPNQFGKDVFMFNLTPAHGLAPMGRYSTDECTFANQPNTDRAVLKNGSCHRYSCNKNSRGVWCGALLMVDGWEIKEDYPW